MVWVPANVTPAEARFAAVAMAFLAVLALLVAGMVYRAEQGVAQAALFVLLSLLGSWQAMHFGRMGKGE